MIALLWLGCATLRYEPVLFPTPDPPPGAEPQGLLAAAVARGLVLHTNGTPVAPADLPDSVAWATWLGTGRRTRGAERDVGYAGWRIEIVRGRTGETDLRWSREPVPIAVSPLEGIRFTDGAVAWTDAEKAEVARAFALLDPVLAPWVADVAIAREGVSPRRPRSELSWYDPRRDPARIEVFDAAFADADAGFAGAPDAPVPLAATTVLHELGHALADAPARRAYAAYVADFDGGGDTRESWRTFRDTARADPLITAFRAVWDPPGPTPYAAHRVHEAFAEAFFLAFADPTALARVQPRAAAWFAAGGPATALTAPR